MTPCGQPTTTLRHQWTCIRFAGHPEGQHHYAKAEPEPAEEPHPNTDWQELAP